MKLTIMGLNLGVVAQLYMYIDVIGHNKRITVFTANVFGDILSYEPPLLHLHNQDSKVTTTTVNSSELGRFLCHMLMARAVSGSTVYELENTTLNLSTL